MSKVLPIPFTMSERQLNKLMKWHESSSRVEQTELIKQLKKSLKENPWNNAEEMLDFWLKRMELAPESLEARE